jgi:ABC-2 type transport system ATP-binding protein
MTDRAAALSIRGLRKSYGSTVAVDGLDLEIREGECFGLLGPNGAGKTTTIEICEGLTTADAGSVTLLGRTWARDAADLRFRIGVSLQETQLSEKLTVAETLEMFRSFYGTGPSVDEVIGRVQLEEKRDSRVGKLSGGQRQRLALACAIVGDPELFFLDEPTTGLDPQSRRQLWELIEAFKARGRTVLLTTHYMEEAERLCDRVAIVDHGRSIALGTPRELIAMLGAEHVIEFTVRDGQPPGEPDLRSLPGVQAVRHEGARVLLEVSQLHETLPPLLAMLERRGSSFAELATHTATLEDVFVSLTGRHLREA